jgi:uncharacterized protein YecE (DUF72 family)
VVAEERQREQEQPPSESGQGQLGPRGGLGASASASTGIPQPKWYIGMIGFSYPEWNGTFYTGGAKKHLLTRYAEHFNAVEINTSFYSVPSALTVGKWAEVTPDDFKFCVKMPRDITHGPTPPGTLASPYGPMPGHLLRDETIAIGKKLIDAVKPLGTKLGSVLLQFPRKFDERRRDEVALFLDRLAGDVPLTIEFRHESWWSLPVQAMLRERNVCLASNDEAPEYQAKHSPDESRGGKISRPIMPTSNFLYIRWLGRHGQFADRSTEHFDPTDRLTWWADTLRSAAGHDARLKTVYGFFDNDYAGHAPATGKRFLEIIGAKPVKGRRAVGVQAQLFG